MSMWAGLVPKCFGILPIFLWRMSIYIFLQKIRLDCDLSSFWFCHNLCFCSKFWSVKSGLCHFLDTFHVKTLNIDTYIALYTLHCIWNCIVLGSAFHHELHYIGIYCSRMKINFIHKYYKIVKNIINRDN